MRRGTPRGRGYNRPPHRPQNESSRQSSGPTPLMANPLQGLKDIDMELELLKRKREIIEQQQEMLSNSYRQRNDYEQPAYNQSRDNRYGDYTRLYDEPRVSNQYGDGGGSSSRKRAYIPVWENESPIKRFSAPSRGVKKAFGSRLGPPPQNSRPEFQARPAAPKPFKRPAQFVPPQKKKEFNPTKVTKRSAAPPPVKLASYPTAERKKLVTATLANTPATARASLANPDSWILRADQEPSRQMVGRMELALGAIMKDLRQANPESEDLFRAPATTRVMKQAVRDRIRTAMMGKVISTSENIQAIYYEMYPPTDDNDVVMRALETQRGSEFITIRSDNPEAYFKKNIYKLMSRKLEEMTHKLEEIYKENNTSFTSGRTFTPKRRYRPNQAKSKTHQWRPKVHVASSNDAEPKTEVSQIDIENTQPKSEDGETKAEDGETKTNDVETKAEDDETKAEDAEAKTDDDINAQPKTDNGESKIDDDINAKPKTDDGESKTDDGLSKTDEVKPQIDLQSNENGSQSKVNEEQAKPDESTSNIVDSHSQTENLPSAENIYANEVPKYFRTKGVVSIEQYKAFDSLMTNKMIHLIKRFTPAFLKVMDVDAMYRRTKEAIINETKKKLEGTPEEILQTTESVSAKKTSSENRFQTPLKYYVKIIGKPSLPKRKAMETFFEEFQPKSVKKHRTMYNLLFVGFAEKEPYEKILAANGTAIGRNILDIRVSERNYDKKNPNNSNNPAEQELNDSGSQIIGSDLDEQISDLLTSIRQSEESDNFADDIVMCEQPAQNINKTDENETVKVGSDIVQGDEKKETAEKEDADVIEIEDVPENKDEVVEIQDVPQNNDDDAVEIISDKAVDNGKAETAADNEEAEKKDTVQALKTNPIVKGTPTRASARLSTPGGIRTRRMSKLE